MSERLHEFNTANAVDTTNQAELINNTGIENLVLDQYSNGANHFYSVDAAGKKTHISQNAILEAYGYDPNAPRDDTHSNENEAPVNADAHEDQPNTVNDEESEDLQVRDRAKLKEHAQWQSKVDTTDTKPSKNGLTPEDIAYNEWLKENATDNESKSVLKVVKERDIEAAAAERKERLRSMAALSSRVKTGSATGQEAAYYYSLKEMSEDQTQSNKTPAKVNIPVRAGNGRKDKTKLQSDLERLYVQDQGEAWDLAHATLPQDTREKGYEPDANKAQTLALEEQRQRNLADPNLLPRDPRENGYVQDIDEAHTLAQRENRARNLQATKDQQKKAERKRNLKFWGAGIVALGAAGLLAIGIANSGDEKETKPDQTTTSVLSAAELQQALGGNRISTNGPNYVELDAERPTSPVDGDSAANFEAAAKAPVDVENGGSITKELQQFAEKVGTTLSGDESFKLYKHLEEYSKETGTPFFAEGSSATFTMADGNYGISAPGEYSWNEDMIREAQKWLVENKS